MASPRGRLVLASRSPQRCAILAQLGVPFEPVAPDVEEDAEGDPRELTVENARRKANAVDGRGRLVLGADTVVVLDERVLGKPRDAREAARFLSCLSGRAHEVVSGIVLRGPEEERAASAVSRVVFRPLSQADIDWYVAGGEWRERAGGYAVQGRGAALVERVEGDFWNVVGLPVAELVRLAPELVVRPAALPV